MTGIFAIHRHMYNRACKMTVMPFNTQIIHHLRISHTDNPAGNLSPYATSGNLLHIRNLASVSIFLRKSTTQSCTYGMSREMLHMRSQMQQFPLIEIRRMNSLDLELAISQCPCLIEHDHSQIRQRIHIIASLYQNSLPRRSTKTTEKRQRHTDYQRTRTRHYQKNKSTVQPRRKRIQETRSRKNRRDKGQDQCCNDDHRRIYPRELGYKRLAPGLVLIRTFHQTNDFRDGTLTESLRSLHPDHTGKINAAGHDAVAHRNIPRKTFSCQCCRIQRSLTLYDLTVYRNPLTWPHDNNFTDCHILRRHL